MDTDALNRRWDVIVVGAGLAGITAAATAAGGGASVLLLDGRERGGQAVSQQVGRFQFNQGAHALYRRGAGQPVLRRLGVKVTGGKPPLRGAKARLGDRVGLLPVGLASVARTDLLNGKSKRVFGRIMSGMPLWRPKRLASRSAADWIGDLTNGDEGAWQMMGLLTRLTTYAADLEQVSADLVAGQIRSGVTSGVLYLDGGWASLVSGLVSVGERSGVRLLPKAKVRQVTPDEGGVVVELREQQLVADKVVLAAGTPWGNAALLPEAPKSWATLGPAAHVACLDLGLPTVPATAILLGIDVPLYLIRHSPPAKRLAPEGAATMHGLRYMRPDEDLAPNAARAELEEHCRMAGVDPSQAEQARYLHRMVACSAVPVPGTGGMAGRPAIDDTGHPNVLVAGDWVGAVGYLADASLVSGEAAGQAAAKHLSSNHQARPSKPVASKTTALAGEPAA